MPTPRTPAGLLDAAVRADAARPLVTFYDDTTGERVELSVATFENWVAKTANLLADELAAEPGARVSLLLPAHWQAAVWLSACWAAGTVAVPGGDPASADVVVAGPDALATVVGSGTGPGADVVGLSLRPMAGRLEAAPPGVVDYAAAAPGQPDRFSPYSPPDPHAPALETTSRTLTAAEVAAAAEDAASAWGLSRGDRVLSTSAYDTVDAVLAGLLAPLAAGGGVVLCRGLDPSLLARRVTTEQVTALFGVDPGAEMSLERLSLRW